MFVVNKPEEVNILRQKAIVEASVPGSAVIASSDIEMGTRSPPGVGGISPMRLLDQSIAKVFVQVEARDGVLCLTEPGPRLAWASLLGVARNCHEQNVELTRDHQGFLLQTTRPIQSGQELLVWFATDLISELEIPFLIPSNFKGNQAYTCHKCTRVFQDPNPLKVHLSFCCSSSHPLPSGVSGRSGDLSSRFFGIGDIRLVSRKDAVETIRPAVCSRIHPLVLKPRSVLGSSNRNSSPPSEINLNLLNCFSSPSSTVTTATESIRGSMSSYFLEKNHFSRSLSLTDCGTHIGVMQMVHPLVPTHPHPFLPPSALSSSTTPTPSSLLGSAPTTTSQIWRPTTYTALQDSESIGPPVVNKVRGHTCVYCGKVYSRKYGLKIHVRTHTGYKPLKCRFCFRPFSDPSNLNKHVRLHADTDTPYRCPHCSKVLVRRRDLERHVKSRHPHENYSDGTKDNIGNDVT